MAITNSGTRLLVSSETLPSGTAYPTVTTFTDYESVRELTLSVLKATVENATPITTIANIIANGTIGITKQVTDIIAAEYLNTPTVTYWSDIIEIRDNYSYPNRMTGDYFDNIAFSYVCVVKVYLKSV